MAKSITMTNPEAQCPQEVGEEHNCTVVVFCNDTGWDVCKDTDYLSVTSPGRTTREAAEKYASMRKNFLFAQHRKTCTGKSPRKHRVTVRLEIHESKEIYYVPLGIDRLR